MTSTAATASQVSNGANGTVWDSVQAKRTYSRVPSIIDVPNLIQVQLDSFEHFKAEGLGDLFNEISPIEDFPGGRFELSLGDHYLDRWQYDTEAAWEAALDRADRDGLQYYHFDLPKFSEAECRERESTYAAALHVTVKLTIKASGPGQGEIKQQKLFIGDIPMMTSTGTFIINGAERVVVSQLVRSPGVYFTATPDANTGRPLTAAKLIPYRGAWMEFETSNRDLLSVKVDRKRKTPISTLLRCLSYFYQDSENAELRSRFETDAGLMSMFEDIDTDEEHSFMRTTIEKDTAKTTDEALLEFYRRLRPGEPPNVENAKNLLDSLFFNPRRYDLGRVGPLQAEPQAAPGQPGGVPGAHAVSGRHRGAHPPDDTDKQRRARQGRHRPSGQPPRARAGRANPEPGARRAAEDGARHQGAHDYSDGPGHHDAGGADEHKARGRVGSGVFRGFAAIAVHGPDEPAGGAYAQAQAIGSRAGRSVARTRRVRRARRSPLALRAHLPHRDA